MPFSQAIVSALALSSAATIFLNIFEAVNFAPFGLHLPITATPIGQMAVVFLAPVASVTVLYELKKIVKKFF